MPAKCMLWWCWCFDVFCYCCLLFVVGCCCWLLLLLLLLDSKLGCGLYVLSGYFVLRQHSLDSGFAANFFVMASSVGSFCFQARFAGVLND